MLDKFWEAAGGKLADRWASVSTPALIFWIGGLICWISGHDGLRALQRAAAWATKQSAATQVVVAVAALLGVAASGVIVQRLATPGLRLIEGYWPSFLSRLYRRRAKAVAAKAASLDKKFQELAGPVNTKTATPGQRAEYVDLDQQRRRLPLGEDYLPTKTGNILRAGERRPKYKYGLDAIVVWPRLWLLLPADTRTELSQARSALDTAVASLIWGLLFIGFAFLAWWAALVGLAVAVVMYLYWVPDRAAVFADLLEAAFDVHRGVLYRSLRWPLPVNPLDELASGEQVTRYLLRGPDGPAPTFTPDSGTHENPPAGGASPERQADTGAAGNEARSAH